MEKNCNFFAEYSLVSLELNPLKYFYISHLFKIYCILIKFTFFGSAHNSVLKIRPPQKTVLHLQVTMRCRIIALERKLRETSCLLLSLRSIELKPTAW